VKIVAYDVKDFKGLQSVSFAPDPWVVLVCGRNGQGKTSLLDSIWATLGGKDAAPDMPVRRGQQMAVCSLDLGDIRVKRTWFPDNTSRLAVENADGARPKTPQALLDSLAGAIAFDPLAFVRESPKNQAATLRKLAGLEDVFSAIDREIAENFVERTAVNRQLAAEKGHLASFPGVAELASVPDEAPSLASLTESYQAAVRTKAGNDQERHAVRDFVREDEQSAKELADATATVERVREQLQVAEKREAEARTRRNLMATRRKAAEERAAALVDPDVVSVKQALDEAATVARNVRTKQERAVTAKRVQDHQAEADGLTARIEALKADKDARMAGATFAVDGLNCAGDVVLLDGVPLQQVSTSQQYRLALSVGEALNPKLRIAMVRDGSLLDDTTLADFVAWAKERDFQLWIERVSHNGEVEGLVIEQGLVKAD